MLDQEHADWGTTCTDRVSSWATLTERESELTRLEYLFCGDDTHEGRIGIIEGPSGSGKSELAATITRQAFVHGFRVLRAAGTRRERTFPFGILSQLVPADEEAPYTQLNEAISTAVLLGMSGDGGDQNIRWDLLHAWCSLIVELSRSTPIFIVVDDAHHADTHSLAILVHLLKRSRTTRVSVLLALTSGAVPADPLSLSELRRHRNCRVIRLALLSEPGVAQVLAERLDAQTATLLAADYHAATGGNPLLVNALIDDRLTAVPDPKSTLRLVIGDAFQHAVLSTVERIDGVMPSLVKAVGVLGDSATPRLLAALLGLDQAHVTKLMHMLCASGILCAEGRFRHPGTREVVIANPSQIENETLSYRAAQLRYTDNAPAGIVARHTELPLSDAEWRVAVLAAQGHTNRQISSDLFITVSTVEQHLTQIYRKLHVVGRKELPLVLRSTVGQGA
ncbi:transcriptional regulator, luxR family [Frankia torreyi]|uniref:Transcriptional regulator, luxR family n=2 Tax=Frankia TaxID=1854 RepID=A0A0D8BBH2_9ACTN|nr:MULTISPECIES: LuxR family transcriptional regulator [Frankia]KJE21284.1 transcriptional regulator, luxR family [Frankia torreyi]